MIPLRYALVADGPSDRALFPVLSWAIRQQRPTLRFAQPDFLVRRTRPVEEAVQEAISAYDPNLLFVHRDAERVEREVRRREIPHDDLVVAVIPVRMTEAWLLVDESALRQAAGNPNGRVSLALPPPSRLESVADPKTLLRELLATASEATGRRRRRFDQSAARQRVADLIGDFSPLRELPAFAAFESELESALDHIGA